MKKKPNIILFNPDQLRADMLVHLGCQAGATPRMDALVQTDAVSIGGAFCQNPVCTPSRCSFMSGWYPHVRGHRTMHHMLRPDEPMMLQILKDNGYFVWWGGKNDLIPGQGPAGAYCDVRYHGDAPIQPNLHADDRWRGLKGEDNYFSFYAGRLDTRGDAVYYDSDWRDVDGAVEFLRHPPEDRPFCIYLALQYPHPPYGVEDPWYSRIDRNQVPRRVLPPEDWQGKPSILPGIAQEQRLQGWTEERWTELRATYLGMCARIDHQFGMILDALKDSGQYDDTAVFLFSDHGDFTGDYGLVEKTQNTFEDCLTHVPFLIKPPKDTAALPGVRPVLSELIDLPATVYDLCGINPGHWQFGRSLVPVLTGEAETHRDAVFCEGGRLRGEAHCMERESIHEDSLYWPRLRLQVQEGPEHTKAVMCRTERYKYVMRLYEQDELYDLIAEPGERCNRIGDPALCAVEAQLKERLMTFLLETSDAVPLVPDER
jgi:arylsulfatase A-like enzyme